jgi:hypothetical protein
MVAPGTDTVTPLFQLLARELFEGIGHPFDRLEREYEIETQLLAAARAAGEPYRAPDWKVPVIDQARNATHNTAMLGLVARIDAEENELTQDQCCAYILGLGKAAIDNHFDPHEPHTVFNGEE